MNSVLGLLVTTIIWHNSLHPTTSKQAKQNLAFPLVHCFFPQPFHPTGLIVSGSFGWNAFTPTQTHGATSKSPHNPAHPDRCSASCRAGRECTAYLGIQRVWPISNVSQFTTDWRGRIFRPYCWRTVPYDGDGFGSNSASQWSEMETLEMRKAHARALLLEHVWQGGKLFAPTMESMLWHLDAIIQGCLRYWWIRMVYFLQTNI